MKITIGHELIHAYSAMNGDTAPEYNESNYRYRNTEGKLVEVKSWTTELETVGIIACKKCGSPIRKPCETTELQGDKNYK